LLEWRPPGVNTGRAVVGSARVNGDGDLAGVDPFPPYDDPPRGYPNRAEPTDAAGGTGHPVHGSPLPLSTPEPSEMINNIPYADRQETADHRFARPSGGYFTPYRPIVADEHVTAGPDLPPAPQSPPVTQRQSWPEPPVRPLSAVGGYGPNSTVPRFDEPLARPATLAGVPPLPPPRADTSDAHPSAGTGFSTSSGLPVTPAPPSGFSPIQAADPSRSSPGHRDGLAPLEPPPPVPTGSYPVVPGSGPAGASPFSALVAEPVSGPPSVPPSPGPVRLSGVPSQRPSASELDGWPPPPRNSRPPQRLAPPDHPASPDHSVTGEQSGPALGTYAVPGRSAVFGDRDAPVADADAAGDGRPEPIVAPATDRAAYRWPSAPGGSEPFAGQPPRIPAQGRAVAREPAGDRGASNGTTFRPDTAESAVLEPPAPAAPALPSESEQPPQPADSARQPEPARPPEATEPEPPQPPEPPDVARQPEPVVLPVQSQRRLPSSEVQAPVRDGDAGRHGGPNRDRPLEPPPREPDRPTPAGRHQGGGQAEHSPWAPTSLPPGYERMPVGRAEPDGRATPFRAEPDDPAIPFRAEPDDPAIPFRAERYRNGPAIRLSEPPPWQDPDPSPAWERPTATRPRYPVGLPQRVPAEPDVPGVRGVAHEPGGEPAAVPELARIATYLRDEDDEGAIQTDDFDVSVVLAAVQVVGGVRQAQVRTNPDGAHTLRLELFDDADPTEVSRAVTRILNEQIGLAAEPNAEPVGPLPAAPATGAGDRRHDGRDATAPAGLSPRPLPIGTPVRPFPAQADQARAAGLDLNDRFTEARALGGRGAPARTVGRAGSAERVIDAVPTGRATVNPLTEAGDRSAQTTAADNRAAGVRPAVSRDVTRRDSVPAHRPLPGGFGAPRVVLDRVEVMTHSTDALVEVRLSGDDGPAIGTASGPVFDGYVLRLAAVAAANAIDNLLTDPGGEPRARCFIENAAVVPLGGCEVAVVVLLLAQDGWVEELSGSAVVNGDQRQAVVRATLAAVNRRLEALLS
jgi:hypothetical protein